MTLLHISDLHIGKTLQKMSLQDDQRYILEQILALVATHRPDAVVIAGDVYDKPVPNTEAIQMFDQFIISLSKLDIAVLMVSGNHDAPERLGFLSRLLADKGVYIQGAYQGSFATVPLEDTHGTVYFHLMPFLKPSMVRPYVDTVIDTYEDCIAAVMKAHPLAPDARHVLVAHQSVTAAGFTPERSESESDPIGGVYMINAAMFADFDYVALGHYHGPQQVGSPNVRYAGSPLKYSLSEQFHHKSAALVTLNALGTSPTVTLLPLAPLRDLRSLRGTLSWILSPEAVASGNTDDFLFITLTDEHEEADVLSILRDQYPNVLQVLYDTNRTRAQAISQDTLDMSQVDPVAAFAQFYEVQNGISLTATQQAIVANLLTESEGAV